MRRALELAEHGRGLTAPTIGFGAVLVLSLIHISEPTRPY